MPNVEILKSRLHQKANALGFELFGVAPAEPLEEDLVRLRAWIAAGHAAGMGYLRRTAKERVAPRLLLAGARSVIVVGMSYAQEPPPLDTLPQQPEGRVARFALARDYHAVLEPRLEELALFLDQAVDGGAGSRRFVDTGPLLERAFAARAGLGFIGKNNCLIHPRHGSWFVLGCVLTTAPLPVDSPLERQCGDCRRCLDVCPGGALVDAYQLDSRRCLSYQTVETRGLLPPGAMVRQGDRLFGCDACQEACPFNGSPLPCREPELKPPRHTEPAPAWTAPRRQTGNPICKAPGTMGGWSITLEKVLRIPSNRHFERFFGGSGLLRPGRRRLVRNACAVAGNLKRKDLVPLLEKLAGDERESAVLRRSAAWALEQMGRVERPVFSAKGRVA